MPPLDLLGVWAPPAMYTPGSGLYDILSFKEDGSGFLDFADAQTPYFNEQFRWSLPEPGKLRLRGERIQSFKAGGSATVERPSTLDAVVSFRLRIKATEYGRRTEVLHMDACPWSALPDPARVAVERYHAHEATYVTFRAPCFELADEAGDQIFRGKALSDFLAERLTAKRLEVGERCRVFLGACYARRVQIGGLSLGLSVNWDQARSEWWVCVRPPPVGGKVEMEDLCETLRDILTPVDGLTDLAWHGEEDWAGLDT